MGNPNDNEPLMNPEDMSCCMEVSGMESIFDVVAQTASDMISKTESE